MDASERTSARSPGEVGRQDGNEVSPSADNPGRRLLKVKQAAEYLSISPRTLRGLVQAQELRIVKLGNRGPWLLDVQDLDQFIEARKLYV